MNIVAFDSETALMRPGVMAPEIVCLSWQRPGFKPDLVHAGGIDDRAALELVTSWLFTPTLIVGQHVAFDMAVLAAKWPHLVPFIFRSYDEDRVTCTKVRQQLLDIAAGEFRGRLQRFEKDVEVIDEETGLKTSQKVQGARWIPHEYDLAALTKRLVGRQLEKDEWRLRYGEFMNVPITQWPEGARKYPKEDARATLDVYLKQEAQVEQVRQEYQVEILEDQFRQSRNAWAKHLTATWGLKTHGPSVDRLEQETLQALAGIEDGLKDAGLVRRGGKKDGTRDTKAAKARMIAVCQAAGKDVWLTEKSGICLDSDACEASEDDLLEDYAELTSLKSVLNKDVPIFRAGEKFPVHTSYGMAASGRSTSGKPNVQNPKRSGIVYRNGKPKYELPDVRECWMPRPGFVYAQADFEQLELRTLAQTCITLFGQSVLGEMLNTGKDPHTAFACSVMGISYEEGERRKEDKNDDVFQNRRQLGKAFNFGTPGGLGAASLVAYARKAYKVHDLTEEIAKTLKPVWFAQFPEMRLFFDHVASLVDQAGNAVVQQLFSNRWRGGCSYTAACNTYFQGLGADAALRALYLVIRACYDETQKSVLFGCRPVLFAHDEIVMEVPDDALAHDRAMEMSRLMCVGANEFLPDVPAQAPPVLATRWSKKMKAKFDSNGRLVPWSPEER